MYSKQVILTRRKELPVLLHTVTKKWLPQGAPREDLEKGYFLSGQERQAVEASLLGDRDLFELIVVPTWECTLRCSHCSVLKQLVKRQQGEIDAEKLKNFINRFFEKYAFKKMSLVFVGGEALIRIEKCLEILRKIRAITEEKGVSLHAGITTNLTLELTPVVLEFLKNLTSITVSVDGTEETHNQQRNVYKDSPVPVINPYRATVENVKRLVDEGLYERLMVQAAVRDDQHTKENFASFLRTFLRMGLKANQLMFGCLHPTDHFENNAKLKNYQAFLKKVVLRDRPCCKFRATGLFTVEPDNCLYDSVFGWSKTKLGTLDDDPDSVLQNRRKVIFDNFPCFQDPKCMECPALGFCWGGCVNGHPLVQGRPSDFCNQQGMIAEMEEKAREEKLIDFT